MVLRANKKIKSLNALSRYYKADDGEIGLPKCMFGRDAEHKFIDVPIHTMVCEPINPNLQEHEVDPDKSEVVAILDQEGSLFIAARGGNGGRGNATYLSDKCRHPRVAQLGAMGEEKTYEIRVKVYAHVAIIGMPNAGKSTFLRTFTNANVKVGEYHFTTLYPQVGVIQYDDFKQVAISDLPGLIEDSHKNRGLGLRFLRHAQRCACLMFLIDLTDDPVRQLEILFRELEEFRPGMSRRPHIIVGNKIDNPKSKENIKEFREYLAKERPNSSVYLISAQRGDNLEQIREAIRELYDEYESSNADGFEEGLVW